MGCGAAKCKDKCECASQHCDLKTCLGDSDCAALFKCAVPKCPCGPKNLPCVKSCVSAAPSAVTKATLGCFMKSCPGSSFVKDACGAAKCKDKCECASQHCDLKTCLGDSDCAA